MPLNTVSILDFIVILSKLWQEYSGEELDGVGDEEVVLVEAGGGEEVPDGRHELLHEQLELVLVLVRVQPDVVADLGAEIFKNAGLVVVSDEEGVFEG